MQNIPISEHPNLSGVSREVKINDVIISFTNKSAILYFSIIHKINDEIWDSVIPNGISIKQFSTGWVKPNGMPCQQNDKEAINEFDFLFMLLNGEGKQRKLFDELIMTIIMRNDKMELLNDYN
jgi:hypothetical protein